MVTFAVFGPRFSAFCLAINLIGSTLEAGKSGVMTILQKPAQIAMRCSLSGLICAIFLLGGISPTTLAGQPKGGGGRVLYVDDTAEPGGNGSAWTSALQYLQDALSIASNPRNVVTEIRVGQGIYLPDRNQINPAGSYDRNATFRLISGVSLKGGYLGASATQGQDPNIRDIAEYQSILSGDLSGDDPAPPPLGTLVSDADFLNGTENTYQVVTALNVNETAVLDGFVITAGHANGPGFGASPDSREQGAGLNIYFSSPTITNCTFLRNWNANHGAVNDHGDFTSIINCTFRANYAVLLGAGMYSHHHSATTVSGCKFFDNFTPGNGAGGYSRSMRFAAYTNCEFRGNKSSDKGGGMYNAADSTTTFANCLWHYNTSMFGGGMYCETSQAMVSNCTLRENYAISQGGAMYNNLGSPSMVDCLFTLNSADGGGAGVWNADSFAIVSQCAFTKNNSLAGGAGLYNVGGNPIVSDCSFTANISGGGGGGMWNGLNSPSISNCTFVDNQALSGGGMYNTDNSSPTVSYCTFTSNHATEGGGLYNFQADSIVSHCTFTANTAIGESFAVGGGMLNYICGATIRDCTFTDNFAEFGGGAVYNEGDTTSMTRCTFRNNIADGEGQGWGGAILNGYFGSPLIENCLMQGNLARRGGGVFNMTFVYASIVNCTIVGNRSTDIGGGGGIDEFEGSDTQFINCVIWHNIPTAIEGGPVYVRRCCVEGGYGNPEDDNLDALPGFMMPPGPGIDLEWATSDDSYGELRLGIGSPCIDAGDNTALPMSVSVDLAGNPRFKNDPNSPDVGVPDGIRPIVDIGAYEFQPRLCTGDIAPNGGDGNVNVMDLLAVINAWGACPSPCPPTACPADIAPPGGNCIVNVSDLLAVINAWGACRP